MFFTIRIDLSIELCLIAARFDAYDFLVKLLFIRTRFDVCGINKSNGWINESFLHRLFQNPVKNLFK
ncbi:hypothetical protein D3C73_1610470 [compost metagenome]